MAHGAGGKATQTLIEGLLAPAFGSDGRGSSPTPARRGRRRRLALTTDSFVVKPIRFPGGSIGELAVNGTVNDLAVAGARPLALTLSLVLEEGLAADDLRAEVEAIAAAADGGRRRGRRRRHEGRRARPVRLDVRLHDRARPVRPARRRCPRRRCGPGDRILVSGLDRRARHRDHARARRVRARRPPIESDTRSLWPAVDALLEAAGPSLALHARRDPRRRRHGAQRAGARLGRARSSCARRPCRCTRRSSGACEILGIDPMYVANEGRLVAFVAPEAADDGARRAAAPCPAARRRPRSARSRRTRPGWCSSRRRSAAGG